MAAAAATVVPIGPEARLTASRDVGYHPSSRRQFSRPVEHERRPAWSRRVTIASLSRGVLESNDAELTQVGEAEWLTS
jgi:hypothetical protein